MEQIKVADEYGNKMYLAGLEYSINTIKIGIKYGFTLEEVLKNIEEWKEREEKLHEQN
jgi:hypothetical protein